MSVIMMLVGSLISALLAIGIIGGGGGNERS